MGTVADAGAYAREPEHHTASVLRDYSPMCVWPSHPVRRIAVLTSAPPHPELVSAMDNLAQGNRWFRWVQHGRLADPEDERSRQAFAELAPWWEWADVVVADADNRSIAECVTRGRVPVVGLPSVRFPLDARRSLDVVGPWSANGLALHLSLARPSLGLLESAAGMRTRRRPERRLHRSSA